MQPKSGGFPGFGPPGAPPQPGPPQAGRPPGGFGPPPNHRLGVLALNLNTSKPTLSLMGQHLKDWESLRGSAGWSAAKWSGEAVSVQATF